MGAAEREAKHKPLAALRERFEAEAAVLRERLAVESVERAAVARGLELELGGARLAREAAEIAVRQVHQVAQHLEAARVHLEAALRRSFVEALLLDGILVTYSKYQHIDRASWQLSAAGQLMREMRALDPVRDDLEPLAPSIGRTLRAADFVLDSFLVDLAAMTRTEDSLDGVREAQRLFADLEPVVAQEARVARKQAENAERRFREALVAVCVKS
jgi:hypothetical protein